MAELIVQYAHDSDVGQALVGAKVFEMIVPPAAQSSVAADPERAVLVGVQATNRTVYEAHFTSENLELAVAPPCQSATHCAKPLIPGSIFSYRPDSALCHAFANIEVFEFAA